MPPHLEPAAFEMAAGLRILQLLALLIWVFSNTMLFEVHKLIL